MRTTITLEADVEALIRAAMRERKLSFKEAVNAAVRAGLRQPDAAPNRFVQKTYPMGANPDFRWDKALAIAYSIEDEEIVRKLSLGK